MNALLARYLAMPRAIRWALWAAVVVIVYLGVIDPFIVGEASSLHTRAKDMAARLISLDRDIRSGRASSDAKAIARYGSVAPPSNDPEKTTQVFNATIYDILKKHNVTKYSSPSHSSPMSPGPLTRTVTTDERAERRIADIQFDASPEDIAGILADMERAPQISAVSAVQVSKNDKDSGSRMLQTKISAETWVITKKAHTPGGAVR